ncbi:hypothetical protein Chor_013161 [Crotalus horridus]
MKLEVANKHNVDTYWVATTIATCGQLLLLRYCGYEDDRRADFWCDVMTADLHPVGWCTQNGKVLMPPDAIKEKYSDWTDFLIRDLTGSRTVPAKLLEGFWIVSVVENVGGRLRLRYAGLEETETYDQWLFYLDCRLRPVGWCQENKYQLEPPAEISSLKTTSEWRTALTTALTEAEKHSLPMEVFKVILIRILTGQITRSSAERRQLPSAASEIMMLEAVNPQNPAEICVASVTLVKGRLMWLFFEGLAHSPASEYIVDVESMNTFPVGWCEANGYKLLAPHKNTMQRKRKVAIVQPEKQIIAEVPIEKIQNPYRLPQTDRMGTVNGRYNCPMLFINHRCFSGPHLNKGRLAELPQSVGPGKCVLVLKELAYLIGLILTLNCAVLDAFRPQLQAQCLCSVQILRMVVNSAYKPRSILRELQLVDDPRWNFQEENLKANEESTYSLESRHNLPDGGKMQKPILTLKRSCPSAADLNRAGSSEEEADTPWSEEINPELQDDLTDASSEEMSLAIPVSTMKLRSSRGSIHVARPESDGHAPKVLSFLRAQNERTRQAAEEMLILESNPLEWTVTDVVQFLRLTDCASLAKIFQEQDIDGQALLLLTLPTVQECMELKLGPAIKLCHQIERVKLAFYAQYAN